MVTGPLWASFPFPVKCSRAPVGLTWEERKLKAQNRPLMLVVCPVTWGQCPPRSVGVRRDETVCVVLGPQMFLVAVVPSPQQRLFPTVGGRRPQALGPGHRPTHRHALSSELPSSCLPGRAHPPALVAAWMPSPPAGSGPHTARASPLNVNRPVLANLEATEKQKRCKHSACGPSPRRPPGVCDLLDYSFLAPLPLVTVIKTPSPSSAPSARPGALSL